MGRKESELAKTDKAGPLDSVANLFIGKLMDFGIDGIGPLASSSEMVARARARQGDPERAIKIIVRDHVKKGGVGGFVTGFGGVFTLPVALPANAVEFYTLATRMVAGIAELRGYDVQDPATRSAIMLALVGADAEDLLAKAGLSTAARLAGSGRLAHIAASRLPAAAGMMINKAVGFRLLTALGGKALGRVVRFVPVAGGLVGAGLDGLLMKRIAEHARREFTPRAELSTPLEG